MWGDSLEVVFAPESDTTRGVGCGDLGGGTADAVFLTYRHQRNALIDGQCALHALADPTAAASNFLDPD